MIDLAPLRPLFPFEGHHFTHANGLRQHYLDEGEGAPVVMVHGNPSWSIYYRNLVTALRGTHRTIVPDHIGCGLSDKPGDDRYAYTLESRVDDLDALLAHLGVTEKVTLVVHDWGGMIGFAWAARHPERIERLVVLNTAAFGLPSSKPLPFALKLGRDTALGGWLIRGLNAFSRVASHVGCTEHPMTPELRAAYQAPYDSWDNRIATLRFVQDIPLEPGDRAWNLVQQVEGSLAQFRDRPMFIGWGLRDFVFDRHFLAEWRARFPQAEVHAYERAGHYVLEDVAETLVPAIARFVRGEAPAPNA